jgi:hypothetical protein
LMISCVAIVPVVGIAALCLFIVVTAKRKRDQTGLIQPESIAELPSSYTDGPNHTEGSCAEFDS